MGHVSLPNSGNTQTKMWFILTSSLLSKIVEDQHGVIAYYPSFISVTVIKFPDQEAS